jgi:Ca-activated chloride channel family protein
MSFLWPEALVAVLLVPIGLLMVRSIDQRRRRRIAAFGGLGLAVAHTRPRRLRDRIPALLSIAGIAFLTVAMGRPEATVTLPRAAGTLVLTFDVSGSMAADDVDLADAEVPPTRLAAAKVAARELVERQPSGVLIGLVAFSDAGLTVLAPTGETHDVLDAIERLGPAFGTSVGEGVLAALDALADAPPEELGGGSDGGSVQATAAAEPVPAGSDTSSAIVLFSDGENTVAPDPLTAAQEAADRGVRVHAVGVGSPEGTILELDGFSVHTRLDEGMLQEVASITGGTYQRAAGSAGLQGVYDAMTPRLSVASESIEVTALVASLGLAALLAGALASLALTGRLP